MIWKPQPGGNVLISQEQYSIRKTGFEVITYTARAPDMVKIGNFNNAEIAKQKCEDHLDAQ